ncbi:hypothetical protein FCF16_03605 [Lentilactobacillus buchneri]|nr:hypothetical protein [Lentilactobacillus buchneri]MCT3543660.1 hypothetical protein [Lentilactobacillus buchneri]MCT3544252.1 hypothetical protein [Lentilactobacillus buchneri]MCT3551763.1 hypothetical protein [Lentilactobacillus buchneri]TJY01523.1 hypothetical protein FCF17_04980 [Lentilactobacillus buchneri]
MTPTIGGGTSGTGGTPAGLEHYVYVTVGNEKSNYSSNGALQDGTNGRQSVIDYQKYKDAGSPEIIEHMYLKNTNADGTKDISFQRAFRYPENIPLNQIGRPIVEEQKEDLKPDVTSNSDEAKQKVNFWANGAHMANAYVTLAPGQWVDISMPLKITNLDSINYQKGTAFQVYEGEQYWTGGTNLVVRLAEQIDPDTYSDFQKGQYLITYLDKDGYYQQAKDIQSLMPKFDLARDITFSSLNTPFGTSDSSLWTGGTYFVDGNKMVATDEKGQSLNFLDMLYSHGYAPVWRNGRLLTYESFNAYEGSNTPGNPDYFKYMRDVLGHNGIGGINWQVVKVLVADNATVNRGAKWAPLDHVTLFDPKQEKNGSASEVPVTKDNVKIASDNGRINADGTLDTSTPGVYNVTYTYEAVYSDSVRRTISKTIQVTVPGNPNGGGGQAPSSNTSDNNANPTNNNGGNNAWNPTNPTDSNGTGLPNYAAVKGAAVYATKRIYLYQHPTFKKSQRLATYPKVARTARPMFVVIGYARSSNGALRYKVRDVNHGKKMAGKIGYITANRKFVVNVYYQSLKGSHNIIVISKKGIHAYKHVNLTGKFKTYKRWTPLKVKRLVHHNLTTRYQLKNGDYVTANKKLVFQIDGHLVVVRGYQTK